MSGRPTLHMYVDEVAAHPLAVWCQAPRAGGAWPLGVQRRELDRVTCRVCLDMYIAVMEQRVLSARSRAGELADPERRPALPGQGSLDDALAAKLAKLSGFGKGGKS